MINSSWFRCLVVLVFMLTIQPAFLPAKPSKSEIELLKKSHELSYEGQVEKAKSLLEGKEGESKEKKEDDGFASLFLSMLWGAIGTGFFIFGKKQARGAFLLCGILLCVFPFFISDFLASGVLGLILCIVPFKVNI